MKPLEAEINKIERDLADKHNEIILLQNQIDNITNSLNTSPDLSKDSIEQIYKEVNIAFSDNVTKTLSELENFYEQLTKNRIQKLSYHKQQVAKKLAKNQNEEKVLKKELDNKMKYLENEKEKLLVQNRDIHIKTPINKEYTYCTADECKHKENCKRWLGHYIYYKGYIYELCNKECTKNNFRMLDKIDVYKTK